MLYSLFFFASVLKLGYSSVASFSSLNSGVEGSATIDDRWVTISLDFSMLDYSMIPGGYSCFDSGLTYHIHNSWTYGDSMDRVGSTNCGSTYTGRHYDPYAACGPSSGNMYCETYNADECITSSSAFDNSGVYQCSPTNYAMNPYVCEVGDLSGKYGTLDVINNMTSGSMGSFWEVNSMDVQGKSIVFHCANTGLRAFCAPFDTSMDTMDNDIWQTTTADENVLASFIFPVGYFAFLANGSYISVVYAAPFSPYCNALTYRIYDSWMSNNYNCFGAECKYIVGNAWDPTVSCEWGSDSQFCNYADYRLCNDSNYMYMCDYANSRYSCAPGDLGGKYGMFNTSNGTLYIVAGEDELFPPFDMIEGKSIALECVDDGEIIAAGVIMNTNSTAVNMTYNFTMNFTWQYNYTWYFNFSMWNFSWWNITWNDTTDMMTTTSMNTITTTQQSFTLPPGFTSDANFISLNFMILGLIGLAWLRM